MLFHLTYHRERDSSLGAIAGFLGAEVMGAFTAAFPENGAGWRYLFTLSAGLAAAAAAFFVIFADASVQSWAKTTPDTKEKTKTPVGDHKGD